jgi:4-hydroxy-3-methylbut-2-en-1-yl diphosphate reductase
MCVNQHMSPRRPAQSPTKLYLAAPRGFCAGVVRAIDIVDRALTVWGPPVYVRHEIVHNRHVLDRLRRRGAVFVDDEHDVPEGARVIFSAHGVSPMVRARAAARRLEPIDATCPLVTKVHVEARRFAERGYTVALIGHSGHPETTGTMGEAPDAITLVQSEEDAAALAVPDPDRVAFVCQTTLSVDETRNIVTALRRRFPAIVGPRTEDVCFATTNRQEAIKALARRASLVLVLGSVNSSNSQRLVETAHRAGAAAALIDDADDIEPAWLDDVSAVGLTAGASAPEDLVAGVVDWFRSRGPVDVEELSVARETVRFMLPRELRTAPDESRSSS